MAIMGVVDELTVDVGGRGLTVGGSHLALGMI